MSDFLDCNALEMSDVVANNTMNRERQMTGSNGYETDLRYPLLSFLQKRIQQQERVMWVDLCCGQGLALQETAQYFYARKQAETLRLVGVDLVPYFAPMPEHISWIERIVSPLRLWQPDEPCDLITCVHGLHYVGDKLDVIVQSTRFLKEDGLFFANLDLANLWHTQGTSLARHITAWFRQIGFHYSTRHRILQVQGQQDLKAPFVYLGAQDQAGPNYTGQPAVNSYYQKLSIHPIENIE